MYRSVALMVALLLPVEIIGCGTSVPALVADANAVATAVVSIAKVESASNPALAAKLTTAAQTLVAATTGWTSGSPTADITDGATAVEAILGAIPQTATVAPLVAIAVIATDTILSRLSSSTTVTASSARNPYRAANPGTIIKHRIFRSPEGDFKAAWNAACLANPALSGLVIK